MVRKSKAMREATDLTQDGVFADIVAPPRKEGDPTGQTGDLEAQTSSTPPINQEAALTSAPANVGPLPSPVNIAAPTAKQFEPNTAGIPVGPGSNGPRVVATNTLQNFLTIAKEITQDPIFDELLAEDIIQEPVVNPEQDDYFGF